MACCAFVVLLALNVLVPLGFRRLQATRTGNPSVAWRRETDNVASSVQKKPLLARRRLVAGVIALQLALAGTFSLYHIFFHGEASDSLDRAEWSVIVAANTLWCGSGPPEQGTSVQGLGD